jgi:hypothetical protein
MNIIEAGLATSHFGASLTLVIIAIRIDYQLKGSIIKNIIVIEPGRLGVLSCTLRLIHYVHFT